MSIYDDSIKCKYCAHFEPGANRCHLYHNYDQSIDPPGGPYYKEVSADSRCSHFILPAMDVFIADVSNRRPDGSYVVGLDKAPDLKQQLENNKSTGKCYVATCVYGSYDCPQVWTLRRFRDEKLSQNCLGRAFIRIYYCISPYLVCFFGNKRWFRNNWKKALDKMINRLQKNGVSDAPYEDKKW